MQVLVTVNHVLGQLRHLFQTATGQVVQIGVAQGCRLRRDSHRGDRRVLAIRDRLEVEGLFLATARCQVQTHFVLLAPNATLLVAGF